MTDKQKLFETAVRDAVVVLDLERKDDLAAPAYLAACEAADESTSKAKAAGWVFEQIEAEARQRLNQ